jgi:Na+-transporting methylmalonyl-CoA/oxaloacetate decarboxylase gamma subunit
MDITNALIVSGISIALVFLASFVIWGLMEIIVRFTADKMEQVGETQTSGGEVGVPIDKRKQRAAAVAVAFASAYRHRAASQSEHLESNVPSTWQSVGYAARISRKGNLVGRRK